MAWLDAAGCAGQDLPGHLCLGGEGQIAGAHPQVSADQGAGVLRLYGNYGGDVMNFDMAAEMADMEGIEVRTVLVKDDVASAPPEEADRRRGVAGMVFAFKVAGAKAEQGGSLDEVEAAARKALDNIRSIGVALSPCTVPAAGRPTFTIGEDEMEIGASPMPGIETSANWPGICPSGLPESSRNEKKCSSAVMGSTLSTVAGSGR